MRFPEKIKNIIQSLPSWKKIGIVFSFLLVLSLIINFFSFASLENANNTYRDYFSSTSRLFGINLPKDMSFAGEAMPRSDFAVREAFEREFLHSVYWQKSMIRLIKRSSRWFPVIEPILKKHGVPDDIKYIALAESHLTNSISPRQAVGFWQLIETTAKHYGLEINDEVDERYSVEKSTEAACKYFKEAYKRFGNWTLAAASYNLGMGGIETQLNKQKVNSYYDLLLNEETGRYVYRVIALKCIIEDPDFFGIIFSKKDLYQKVPTVTVNVDSSITDLVDFSIRQGYNYKILKIFNPWLRKTQLINPEKKLYHIIFPKKEYIHKSYDDIEGEVLKEGLRLDSVKSSAVTDTIGLNLTKKHSGVIHIVKDSDSWESICKKYGVSKEQIVLWNMLDENSVLERGMEFVIFPVQQKENNDDKKSDKSTKKGI